MRLRDVRIEKGMTQEELAERSGVHRDTILKLETGQRDARPATLKKLADALGVRSEEIDPKNEGRNRMREERTITVPGWYPTFKDADTLRRFDDSREAWMWDHLDRFRTRAIVETAARIVANFGDDVDLPGLMDYLWRFLDKEDAEEFIEEHREEINRRAWELAEEHKEEVVRGFREMRED